MLLPLSIGRYRSDKQETRVPGAGTCPERLSVPAGDLWTWPARGRRRSNRLDSSQETLGSLMPWV